MMNRNKRKYKGFSLGEVIMTVAIVGSITVIAVPQFIRLRAQANMEMVRQQMRVINEKMVEILGRERKFPAEQDWPDNLVHNEEEMSISASLSAIDRSCYTITDYHTNETETSYHFCSEPQPNSCGKQAGSKRFCVHYDSSMSSLFAPGVVGEVGKLDIFGDVDGPWMYQNGDRYAGMQTSYETDLPRMVDWLQQAAHLSDYLQLPYLLSFPEYVTGCSDGVCPVPEMDAGLIRVPVSNMTQFMTTLEEAYPLLFEKGIKISVSSETEPLDSNGRYFYTETSSPHDIDYGSAYQNGSLVNISFHFEHPEDRMNSLAKYYEIKEELCSDGSIPCLFQW